MVLSLFLSQCLGSSAQQKLMGFLESPSRHWHLSGSADFGSKEMFLTVFKNYGIGCSWRSTGVDLSFFLL